MTIQRYDGEGRCMFNIYEIVHEYCRTTKKRNRILPFALLLLLLGRLCGYALKSKCSRMCTSYSFRMIKDEDVLSSIRTIQLRSHERITKRPSTGVKLRT